MYFSSGHFCGVFDPQAEGICPCMSVGDDGEIVAARTEDRVDLIVGRKEPLCLTRRFKPSHDLLTFSVQPM